MTYRDMRTLFEILARYDGRLTVLTVRSQEPWTQWSVCLRDHVHQTWMCFAPLDQFMAYAQGRGAPDGCGAVLVPRERPLAELGALPEPEGASMTWLEVLRALARLEHGAPCWVLAWIEATRPEHGSPRYRLVVRHEGGTGWREADSYAAFEAIMAAEAG